MPNVVLLEPMLRFECNRKGCCCQGWYIGFEPGDLVTVLGTLSETEREELVRGWTFWVDDENVLQRWQFQMVGEGRVCQFLADDGNCGFQVAKGVEALPRLCRVFPVYCHASGDELELHFDAMCPSVLDRLDEGDGPLALAHVEVAPESDLGYRAARALELPPIQLGTQELSFDELRGVRATILAALARCLPDGPAPFDVLGRVHYALARVARGQPVAELALGEEPPGEFAAYFDACVRSVHHAAALAKLFRQYARFVFDVPLPAAGDFDDAALAVALAPDPAWATYVDPCDPVLKPLLARFLAYRFFMAFDRSPAANLLAFTYGNVTHSLATAFRYAVGLSKWLGRPVDRSLLKVALGASEYVYRTLRVPTSAMPWFQPLPEPAPVGGD